jgi:hypothetical protein
MTNHITGSPFLSLFLKTPGENCTSLTRQRKSLIEHVHKGQILALSEIALNILGGVLRIPDGLKVYLRKKARALRILSSRRTTLSEKKKVLTLAFVEAICEVAREKIQGHVA